MANYFLRFPGNKHKAMTFSYDDGPREDVKLMKLFNEYGIKATFNINSGSFPTEDQKGSKTFRMTAEEAYALYKNSGHEVACHTLSHANLPELPAGMAAFEVMKDRENLEELFGEFICGMSYPYGTYNEQVMETLKNAGILYARTSDSSHSFAIPKESDFLHFDPTSHHADSDIFELVEKFKAIDLTGRDRDPVMFYIWGHSFEFDSRFGGNWDGIEKLVKSVAFMKDTWYATNGEIFSYISAFNKLVFTMNKRFVKNPTDKEICFFYNEKDYTIKPGETLELA